MKKLTIIAALLLFTCISQAQIGTHDFHQSKLNKANTSASIEYANGFFALKNKNGKFLTDYIFSDIRPFSNGLSAVEIKEKWGFVNNKGELVIPAKFDIVFDFKEEITMVYADGKWLGINKKGAVQFIPQIDNCFGFENGVANIEYKGRTGVMNNRGEINFQFEQSNKNNQKLSTNNRNTSNCPNNIDFENGSFDGWQCFTGTVDTIGNTNIISVLPSSPVANRHKLIARSESGNLDQYGLFSTNAPDGSNYSVRLGNKNSGAQAERIRYTVHVPENAEAFSIKYNYAVVFQDPGHTDCSQPRFVAKLFDSAANAYVDCATADYIATSNLPGFAVSAVDPVVIYKPWTSVFINLKNYAGKTMFLEFTTADCARRAHWGYAYLDVENICQQNIVTQFDCATPSATTVQGPDGFEQYQWYNHNYTTLLASGRTALINNNGNEIVHLVMIPYNGFGCTDTLTTSLSNSNIPTVSISNQQVSCSDKTFKFKSTNHNSEVNWNFGDGIVATGDSVSHVFLQNGEYQVSMTTTTTAGCSFTEIDTVIVNNEYQQGEIIIDSVKHCSSTSIKLYQTDSLNNNIIWNFGDGTSSTGNNVEHDYTVSGNYTITSTIQTSFGCSYQKVVLLDINVPTLPTINIIAPNEICTSTEFYASVSVTGNNSISSVLWNAPSTNIVGSDSIRLSLEQAGTFGLSVDVTTTLGCLLSANKNIIINNKPIVNALSDISLCSGAKSDSIVLTGNGTGNTYFWNNNNTAIGLAENGQLIIPSFITLNQLTENTSADITVYATSDNGCVSDTVHFSITINASPLLNIADTIRQCLGTAQVISLAQNLNYQWFPSNGLSCDNCAIATVNINENTAYSIEATDINGCKNRKSLLIEVIQPTQLSINTQDTICAGRSVHLHASGSALYQWYPETGLDNAQSSDPVASPSSNTNYRLIGSDSYGCFSDTQFVFVASNQMSRNDVFSEVSAISGSTLILNAPVAQNNIISYEWSPNVNLSCYDCPNPQLNVENNITYTLKTVNNRGCVTEQNIDVKLSSPKAELFIPNTFSPDGNGVNDILYIRGKGFTVKSFTIYNRNGKAVFQKNNFTPNDINAGWDGKVVGIKQPSDTYVYITEIIGNDGTTTIHKGNTSLLR